MAHHYHAAILWSRDGSAFTDQRYSRAHVWRFDGVEVRASASPLHVPAPMSRPDAVDPEEAFVAALSSCHMLFFLYFAARSGFVVDRYEDEAVGVMTKNERGKLWVSAVTLAPRIAFAGERRPSEAEIADLHHRSHAECYLANSVLTEVAVAGLPVHA